ncbi:hypothetical protein D0T51_10240 [Parabacteroides sp. 52]|uniref:NVEALA domain-containing protein n=1 Tax=unclassified Parabacteroides TaxID=2649774 RepID=UPI0013D74022|nr:MULTISPECIES: NVEALA domain-containing protein [unclassified Parabacteroides]MDH6534692.1 hypothetical protein [Parabacteroides sp. PM5-20]NDV56104.1 hypothetical protein [Parabacteroides sp. 52]
MKKRIIGVALMATMAFAASWGISQNKNKVSLSDLALSNVEALAEGENNNEKCSDYCQEWSGSSGGGMACDCGRFSGKCKAWC